MEEENGTNDLLLSKHLPHYLKVLALGDARLSSLLDGTIVVEEKVDGANFRFGVIGGKLLTGSHKVDFDENRPPDSMFKKATAHVEWVHEKTPEVFPPNVVFYAEWLAKPKHNTNEYERTPNNGLMLFDGFDLVAGRWLSVEELTVLAGKFGIDAPYILWAGDGAGFTADMAKELTTKISYLGKCTVEGIVIKNYSQQGGDRYTMGPQFACGKFVRKSFKEENKLNWHRAGDIVTQIVTRYKTTARWEKAVNHLREAGQSEGTMRDMKGLLDELERDIREECVEAIKTQLWEHYERSILKGIQAGLPMWYKERLLGAQFENVSSGT